MFSKKNTTSFLIVTILIIVIGGYSYYQYHKPVGTLKNVASDIFIESNLLLDEFNANEESANLKYLDKVISVTGEVTKIEKDKVISIYLKTNDQLSRVICQLDKSHTNISIEEGEIVEIKGSCSGFLMDVILVNCTIVK